MTQATRGNCLDAGALSITRLCCIKPMVDKLISMWRMVEREALWRDVVR